MPKKSKGDSREYAEIENRILKAIASVQHEKNINISRLSKDFDIPYYRLYRRIHNKPSKSTRKAAGRKLDDAQELAVTEYLGKMDDMGMSARLRMVPSLASAILKESSSSESTVGEKWAPRFLRRHPELSKSKQRPIDVKRYLAQSPYNIGHFLDKLKEVLDTHAIQPCDIYNFDESGFQIGVAKNQRVLVRSEHKHRAVCAPGSNNRELLTVAECISADGEVLPPFLILKGVTLLERYLPDLPAQWLVGTSETAFINDELAIEYFQHFNRYSKQRQQGSHRLLLLDGHGSHLTKQVIDFCNWNNIIIYTLPPHSTHFLQPLDVGVFQAYKHFHKEAIDAATRAGSYDFSRVDFLAALPDIRMKVFKPNTIRSAWAKCGIYPFKPDIVLDVIRRQRTPSPNAQLEGDVIDSTPSSGSSHDLPTDIKSLERRTASIKRLSAGLAHDELTERIKLITDGALLLAHQGKLAQDALAQTKAATNARVLRANRNRKQLDAGGVVYLHQARDTVERRGERDRA